MKKHLRLILLAIISMIVPLGLKAQEDVTANYLLNPSFEEGPTFFHSSVTINGWNVSADNLSDAFLNTNDGGTPPDGANVFGVWSPNSVGDFEVSQTVKNLPAGTYTISCVLTVTADCYSTQRLFASTNSQGTKARYFGTSSLAVVPGEAYEYAGFKDDGTGNGPFHPMEISIKVAAGDSLVFGIRANGKLSTICPFSDLTNQGFFKVDNFKLIYIADENAFVRAQIQENSNLIKAVPTDSIPGGYADIISASITETSKVLATQTNPDSLAAYNTKLKNFILTLGTAKTKFLSLQALMLKVEDITSRTNYPDKNILNKAYDDAWDIYVSSKAVNADFDNTQPLLQAAYNKYAWGFEPENLAFIATPTTSFVSGWEKLAAVNDGFEPLNSGDRSHPIYGNWNDSPDYGKTNWVEYDWDKYNTLTTAYLYWFSDGNGITTPSATAYIEYWQDGAWKKAGNVDTLLDQYNALELNNIKTNKIRLSIASISATGICEFKVIGLRKVVDDIDDYKRSLNDELIGLAKDTFPAGYIPPVAALKQKGDTQMASGTMETIGALTAEIKAYRLVLDSAKVSYNNFAVTIARAKKWLDETSLPNKDKMEAAYNSALSAYASTTYLLADFNTAEATLRNAINDYALVSCKATVTTSLCSTWEKLEAINDGYEPLTSKDNSHKKYGNWSSKDSLVHWVQYEWPTKEIIKNISVYWFSDGGGLGFPDSTSVEYFDGTEWKALGAIGVVADQFNTLDVDIQATKLKISMRSTTSTGIIEFRAIGYDAPVGIKELKQNAVNVYPTMVKRGSTMNVSFAKEISKPLAVELFTVSGQKVYSTSVSGKASTVGVPSSLSSGIYLMVFNAPEGRMFKKIVVE